MRIKTFKNGGYTSGGFTSGGGTMTGPLILAGNPVGDLEATTKQYVDSKVATFDASKFTSGTLQVGRLPVFVGDVTSTGGSNNISLANSGVSGGVFCKVTVNAKGLITAGGGLSESDIPDLDWSKFTSGKPNTIAGYGITDGLTKAGGTVTGSLTLHADPTSTNHLATKQYVDNASSSSSVLKTGDITTKMVNTTPAGFLRCNGGEISKTTYSVLYAVVGDAFTLTANPGAGQPWRQQYDINTEQSADVTGWVTGTSLATTMLYSQAVVTKNRVYLLGGTSGAGITSTIYSAPINADGTVGSWGSGMGNLPIAMTIAQAIVTKNRVYVLGGSDVNGNVLSSTYTAVINADGTLGTWSAGSNLPGGLCYSQAILTNNRVYLLGGRNAAVNAVATVYTAPIDSNGVIGTWTVGTSLPSILTFSHAIVTKNRVYLLGGEVENGVVSTIYTAPINIDGTLGTWTSAGNLPVANSSSQVIVTKNRVYMLGGYNGSGGVNSTYSAPINTDGTLGAWVAGTNLATTLRNSHPIVTKNHIYLLGGSVNGVSSSAVYTASISGGLNDYSSYYNGSLTATDPANFRLPDLTASDLPGSYSYIKT